MADNKPTLNIFTAPTKDDIRVGYISTDRGFVGGITICEANTYAKANPGTVFILRNRENIKYIGINEVNQLTPNDIDVVADDCGGIKVDKTCNDDPKVIFSGGGGIGAKANPVILEDGTIASVDVVEGGFGYQFEPIVRIKDPCGVGAGAVATAIMEEEYSQFVVYDDEEDFENYEICQEDDVEYGKRYGADGSDIGEWNPSLYIGDQEDPFLKQVDDYIAFLQKNQNPFWTSRTELPLRVTSAGKNTRAKYDVSHWAWAAKVDPKGKYDEAADSSKGNIVNDRVWMNGQLWRTDVDTFMNRYAISPIPMSNAKDTPGQEYYFEWDVEFPHAGEYIFKIQCDNSGSLYVDNKQIATYQLGSGGAAGNVLSPPEETKVNISEGGFKKVRVDVTNFAVKKKVAKAQQLSDFPTSNSVDFKLSTASLYGATASIQGLDVSIEKSYGADNNVTESFTRDVEFGKIYDVKLTSNTSRVENVPITNTSLEFTGLHPANNPITVINGKQLALRDGDGNDTNASFTINGGTATFSEDGRSIKGTGNVNLTLSWNDARRAGRSIDRIKIGSAEWLRSGSSGSVTRSVALGGGIQSLGGDNTANSKLRTKGQNVLQMEDFTDGSWDDVIILASQGRFFDINGLTCKFTLGEPPATTGQSTENQGEYKKIFNSLDSIGSANIPLWRINPLPASKKQNSSEGFLNLYGISPFDTSITHDTNYPGTHTIKWTNVNFPVSGEYDIGIAVDDSVTLKIGNEVNIFKEGFIPGTSNYTGSSLYRRFIPAGNYTIEADLNQIPGGRFGIAPGNNPMALAINIATSFKEVEEVDPKSWNENPVAIAVSIDAPNPPIPQEPEPIQEGRCPPNPYWTTRFAGNQQWHPVSFDSWSNFKNRHAMSPIPPYSTENTSGGGKKYTGTWDIDVPYDGFYKLKAEADDTAKFWVVPRGDSLSTPTLNVNGTVGVNTSSVMVGLSSGPHQITVEVENVFRGTTDVFSNETISQRVFSTIGWGAQGTKTQIQQSNEVELVYVGLNAANKPIRVTNNGKTVELKDGHGNDANASFNITSGDAKFSDDGKKIEGSGTATIVLTWNDRERSHGVAIESINIGGTKWTRKGRSGRESNIVDIGTKVVEITNGTGTGTTRDGVTYSGPELFHLPHSSWGSFMNKSSVSPNKLKPDSPVVNYTWSNIDFPEDGEYEIAFQMDHSATLFLDGEQVGTNTFKGQDLAGRHKVDFTGEANFKTIKVNKGKHTLTVKPTVYTEASGGPIGFIDALFQQSANYIWNDNPSGFAIEIRKNITIREKVSSGKAKSWMDNPVSVAGLLIPPPCPKRVKGKGVVKEVEVVDPGNGFPVTGGPGYPVALELTKIKIDEPGINYGPDDEVIITGDPGDPVIPPFNPPLGNFGVVLEIPVTGAGFTTIPDVSIATTTGTGFRGTPVFTPIRDPLDIPPDRLIQVTDLVGLKQTGYYDGRPYYGAVFYKEGVRYAGYYETAGQLIQVYDTLQESIDAQVTTSPSAIQRQGTDVNSNNPRLNIPGTPDNLIS